MKSSVGHREDEPEAHKNIFTLAAHICSLRTRRHSSWVHDSNCKQGGYGVRNLRRNTRDINHYWCAVDLTNGNPGNTFAEETRRLQFTLHKHDVLFGAFEMVRGFAKEPNAKPASAVPRRKVLHQLSRGRSASFDIGIALAAQEPATQQLHPHRRLPGTFIGEQFCGGGLVLFFPTSSDYKAVGNVPNQHLLRRNLPTGSIRKR